MRSGGVPSGGWGGATYPIHLKILSLLRLFVFFCVIEHQKERQLSVTCLSGVYRMFVGRLSDVCRKRLPDVYREFIGRFGDSNSSEQQADSRSALRSTERCLTGAVFQFQMGVLSSAYGRCVWARSNFSALRSSLSLVQLFPLSKFRGKPVEFRLFSPISVMLL